MASASLAEARSRAYDEALGFRSAIVAAFDTHEAGRESRALETSSGGTRMATASG
jgi:hypothetical protein